MKRILASLSLVGIAALIAFAPAAFTTGCATSGTTTNWAADPAFITNAGLFIKSSTAATLRVVDLSPDDIAYLKLSSAALKLVSVSNATPATVETAIMAIPVHGKINKYVLLGISEALSLYELYWAQSVQNAVNSEVAAQVLITSIYEGIDLGLSGQTVTISPRPLTTMNRRVALIRRR